MLEILSKWVIENPEKSLPVISAALTLFFGGMWSILTFLQKIRAEKEQRDFDRYRLLSKEITVGKDGDDTPYIPFQLDAIYELRSFRKYYPRTLWMLKHLRVRWDISPNYNEFHIEELDETIAYISHRKTIIGVFIFSVPNLIWWFHKAKPKLEKK
ncbi:hypothetical protein [Enterobacter cloacae]|uniref:hypothetical protein n=1 Tax=Enterobacter cloacae TaxID=550 RepID=UPI002175C4ED|nr:hypothetical protein [Enterobacter cloacae]UWA63693.1 hypothetical protein M5S62_12980 [Enterobacter cloacae]